MMESESGPDRTPYPDTRTYYPVDLSPVPERFTYHARPQLTKPRNFSIHSNLNIIYYQDDV